MSSAPRSRSAEEGSSFASSIVGATVYDPGGCRVGFVDSVDPAGTSMILVEAGYVPGLLGREFTVTFDLVRQAEDDRVELVVPLSDLTLAPTSEPALAC
jgi:hypothetical protein